MATNYKAPPLLKEDSSYKLWKKEIKLWKTFTDLDAKKQGPAIWLLYTGKAREAASELSVENLDSDTGVVQLLAKLDELYLKDKDQLAYAAYDSFENFERHVYKRLLHLFPLFFFFLKICCFLHWIQSVNPHFYVTLYYNGCPYICDS